MLILYLMIGIIYFFYILFYDDAALAIELAKQNKYLFGLVFLCTLFVWTYPLWIIYGMFIQKKS